MSHHQIEKLIAVVQIEISNAVAISFAHSQYDTNFSSVGLLPRSIIPSCRHVSPLADLHVRYPG